MAWADDDRRGFSAYRAAVSSSGVEPPDTDLLQWGAVMGLEEASAHARLERLLERAIVAGELEPGAAGWKASAASLCERALREPAPHASSDSWLSLVIRERAQITLKDLPHPIADGAVATLTVALRVAPRTLRAAESRPSEDFSAVVDRQGDRISVLRVRIRSGPPPSACSPTDQSLLRCEVGTSPAFASASGHNSGAPRHRGDASAVLRR